MNRDHSTEPPWPVDFGRHPQAGEAATEIGADEPQQTDDFGCVRGLLFAVGVTAAAVAAALLLAATF